jgi:hypothetical protein
LVCVGDGRTPVGYRVPARVVDSTMKHVAGLEKWVDDFGQTLPEKEDKIRGVCRVRHYGC